MWKIVDESQEIETELDGDVFRSLLRDAASKIVPDLDLGLAKVTPIAPKKHVCLIGGRGSGKSMLIRELATSGYYETYLKAASKDPEERSVFEKAYMDYIDKGR